MYSLIFFFSSRRRHTRYWRDWSSDVCSSDLIFLGGLLIVAIKSHPTENRYSLLDVDDGRVASRSEERRVGKECRSRRWPYHKKKKNNQKHRHDKTTNKK